MRLREAGHPTLPAPSRVRYYNSTDKDVLLNGRFPGGHDNVMFFNSPAFQQWVIQPPSAEELEAIQARL